jgi:hypothetical protein
VYREKGFLCLLYKISGICENANIARTGLLPFSSVAWLARCRCHEVLSSLGLLRGGNLPPALTSPVSSSKQVITIYIYLLVYL